MIVKINTANNRTVLAIIDDELYGKNFYDGNRQLILDCLFYKGEKKDENEVKKLLKGATILNCIGEKTIKWLKINNILTTEKVLFIAGIPYTEILLEPL